MDEVRDTLLCEVANEVEAAMVVNLLAENEVPAHSDASPAGNAFGGLAFESGHKVYVAASLARKARGILESYPHFKKLRNVHEPSD
jgi:Putative prokaryotic signal transducing protein